MTANAVKNDQKKQKPASEEVATYAKSEGELRRRFLDGTLDTLAILDQLQVLMEMTRGCINCNAQPEIPTWADQQKPIIQHVPCGMVEPGKIVATSVFADGEEFLEGEEFLTRAQKLPGAMNACAFDFYAKPENWKYLPAGVDVIVFPNTVFRGSDGDRYVRYLYRIGAEWKRDYGWLDDGFARDYLVASLANPLVSEAQAS